MMNPDRAGRRNDDGEAPVEVNAHQAEVIPRKPVSLMKRAWSAITGIIPGLTSNQASAESRKRSAGNPAAGGTAPAKRQRPLVTQDQDPAGHFAEQAARNLVRDKKGSWPRARYEDVKAGQIIELKFKVEEDNEPIVVVMRVAEVDEDRITGAGLPDFTPLNAVSPQVFESFLYKSEIEEIKILKVNGKALDERDDGASWSLGEYEEVKAGQIIELKVKYFEEELCTCIMRVTGVEKDGICGFWGEDEWREPKSDIQQIKILKMYGEVVYE